MKLPEMNHLSPALLLLGRLAWLSGNGNICEDGGDPGEVTTKERSILVVSILISPENFASKKPINKIQPLTKFTVTVTFVDIVESNAGGCVQ